MPAPTPPESINNSCSVIFNNTLYVYSPNAFQSISLEEDAKWEEQEHGISVTGAVCVQADVDGDDSQQALYVIGGSANSTVQNYSGLQRYRFDDNTWETVDLPSEVIRNRVRHGANYIPRDHKLVVYGGSSVQGYEGASSETFAIGLKPPYPVAGYESNGAPPASKPFVMPWGYDSVVMVGGSSTNTKIFTFTAGGGWVNLGLDLPAPLPNAAVAQGAMFTLQDGSKILQMLQLGQNPIGVTSHVLLGANAQPATFGETVGGSSIPPVGALATRQSLSTYPAYNESSVPDTTRTDFSIAQGSEGLLAVVGGDDDGSVTFFNQAQNNWVPAERLLGDAPQTVLQPSSTSSSSSSSTPTASATATRTPSPTATQAASNNSGGSGTKTWTILGGVLGGLCGLVAILIIALLCIRNKRREKKRREGHKSYPAGKKASTDLDFEDGTHPLRENGQPMGRSPVASQIIQERGSAAFFSSRPNDNLIRRISSDNRSQPDQQAATYGIFRREKSPIGKSPLAISKPMNPNLGDYQDRPSIDLGRATPASPVNATPLVAIPSRNKSQRKTDEAWAKYFTAGAEKANAAPTPEYKPHGHKKSISGGFWPGSGVLSKPTPPKFAFRDSAGNTLQTQSVGTASPAFENGPADSVKRCMSNAAPRHGRISNANSASSDGSEYEDQELDPAFSSGIPASVQGNSTWGADPGNWTSQRNYNPPPTAFTTSSTGGNSQSTGSSGLGSTGIPNFPMPASNASKVTVNQVQHPAATHTRSTSRQQDGYFPTVTGHTGTISHHQRDRSINTDESDRFSGGRQQNQSDDNYTNAQEHDDDNTAEGGARSKDMLYQYLLDEVARKQPTVVVKRKPAPNIGPLLKGFENNTTTNTPAKNGSGPTITGGMGTTQGVTGSNGVGGLPKRAGEPVIYEDNNDSDSDGDLEGRDGDTGKETGLLVLSRSRSEKVLRTSPKKKAMARNRAILARQQGDSSEGEEDGADTPEMPRAAAIGRLRKWELQRRGGGGMSKGENRLTM